MQVRVVEEQVETFGKRGGHVGRLRVREVLVLPLDPDDQAREPGARAPRVVLVQAAPDAGCALPVLGEVRDLDRGPGLRVPPQVRGRIRRRELRVLNRLPNLTAEFERRRENLADGQASEAEDRANGAGGHAEPDPLAAGNGLFPFLLPPGPRTPPIHPPPSRRTSAFSTCPFSSPAGAPCARC